MTPNLGGPNPYVEARALTDATQARLLTWLAERLAEAGYAGVSVVDDRAPPTASTTRLLVWPYRLLPWPRRVESTSELPLLRVGDKQAGVPEPWKELARLLTRALDATVPQGPRPTAAPALSTLPAPLAAWYARMGEPWLMPGEGGERARLPALMWRPAFVVRASFLVFAEVPPGAAEVGLSMLSALALAISRERTLPVDLPGPAPDEALLGLLGALGEASPPDLAAELAAATAALSAPARWNLTIVPFPELEHDDLAALCRAIGRPLRASVHLAVQIPLGAGPALSPASGTAHVHMATLER